MKWRVPQETLGGHLLFSLLLICRADLVFLFVCLFVFITALLTRGYNTLYLHYDTIFTLLTIRADLVRHSS